MNTIFYGIEDLFVNVLLAPFDALRAMESWWGANSLNWIFIFIGFVAFIYWMLQLKKFNDNGEENKEVSAHSYL
ncbi:hypothetical protein KCTC52924_01340 [Arenibacter antarcticus]|uniref:Uracil phosphoribosyltransferase n=1 Tax=Arenibacter antarcticus TaxID=2040469 RepID=A0ABW5V9N8_9FLAO|nr:uracil phosphoribosyltransferase [Arenibacter sp. H213]MCM4167846.1 uracil phosphoribosyltransferase [Arenibacter sp. H213]